MKKIYIKSMTGTKHEVSYKSIKLSMLISDMLEDSDENEDVIPLRFSDDVIIKTIEYLDYFITDPYDSNNLTNGEKISRDLSKHINTWYLNYIDIDIDFLGKLLNAADFLHIEPLIELCCLKFAHIIKKNSLSQLKEMFIIDELSEEERIEFIQAHAWTYI